MEMIINSTNIGKRLSGIGRSSLSLSLYLLEHWDYPFSVCINSRAAGYFEDAKNKDKIRISAASLSPDFGFKGHLKRLLWTNRLTSQDHDTIVFNTSQMEGSLRRGKQIITVHDLIPLQYQRFHKRQYLYFKYILPRVLNNSIKVIASSHHTKELITQCYGIPSEKINVIYLGIGSCFSPKQEASEGDVGGGGNSDGDYILYVGRLSATKNIERLVKAFEILVDNYKLDLKLKLTGWSEELNFKINKRTKEQMEFLGDVPEDKLADLYRNASLLAFPSLYEGFGLPPLEAMASGCPAVVSDAGSLPEVCSDAAYYVDPLNVESISEGIFKVHTDTSLKRDLTAKGLERARHFSWEKSAKEYIKVFEEATGMVKKGG